MIAIVSSPRCLTLQSAHNHCYTMVGFKLPAVEENTDGWGPSSVPPQFEDVPFMPFSKGERLGRIADFGQQAGQRAFQGAAQGCCAGKMSGFMAA